jgi:transposase InsO family protein
MPFSEVSLLSSRRSFIESLLVVGLSLSEACRVSGVSRTTGYKWLRRYEADADVGLHELSRRPMSSPLRISSEQELKILSLKAQYPAWGAKKLAVLFGEGSPSVRTVDRVLERHGLTHKRTHSPAVGSFEMENCNMLWQMDHKGVPRGTSPLFGCVDDASRFCIILEPVKDQSLNAFWEPLWDAFGIYGLPDAILTDNGVAFKNLGMKRCSSFELRLMLLGIRPIHGRPYHPQTQGKIERFFGTLERDKPTCIREFRDTYNNIRPHESLRMQTPSSRYELSTRKRPSELPPVILSESCIKRKTSIQGIFTHQGRPYRVGRAVGKTTIGILDDEVYYGPVPIGKLEFYAI